MSSTQVLSIKASIRNLGYGIEIKRRTYNGRRNVIVPQEVVEWSITNRQNLVAALPSASQSLCFETPDSAWRVMKSLWSGVSYIGYSKHGNGVRCG